MVKRLLSVAALMFFSNNASAADLGDYSSPAPSTLGFSWSGLHVG